MSIIITVRILNLIVTRAWDTVPNFSVLSVRCLEPLTADLVETERALLKVYEAAFKLSSV